MHFPDEALLFLPALLAAAKEVAARPDVLVNGTTGRLVDIKNAERLHVLARGPHRNIKIVPAELTHTRTLKLDSPLPDRACKASPASDVQPFANLVLDQTDYAPWTHAKQTATMKSINASSIPNILLLAPSPELSALEIAAEEYFLGDRRISLVSFFYSAGVMRAALTSVGGTHRYVLDRVTPKHVIKFLWTTAYQSIKSLTISRWMRQVDVHTLFKMTPRNILDITVILNSKQPAAFDVLLFDDKVMHWRDATIRTLRFVRDLPAEPESPELPDLHAPLVDCPAIALDAALGFLARHGIEASLVDVVFENTTLEGDWDAVSEELGRSVKSVLRVPRA